MFHFSTHRLKLVQTFCPSVSTSFCMPVRYGRTSPATSPHLMFINDVTVMSS